MKILLTLPRPLFPPDTGGKIRSLEIFSRLASRAEIHAVSLADPVRDAVAIGEMKSLFKSYTPVFWRETSRDSLSFYTELLANQFSSLPYFLDKFDLPRFRVTVGELLAQQKFDLLFCDFLHSAVPLRTIGFKPKVVFEHNVEFLLRKRKWQVEEQPLRKFILGTEWRKTRSIEAQVCQSFDQVIAVSPDDQDTLEQEFGINHLSTLPTGVDADFFRPVDNCSRPGHLVFVGSMDWDPNEDGMVWFMREVYPQVRRQVPNASLAIVGRNPSARLRAIGSKEPSVDITGWVADVRPYLAQAEVVICPLRVGGGTRIKIPEAMAMKKPVVSTAVGAEGLPFCHHREIRIATEANDFAQTVTDLLKNRSLRNSLGIEARERVVRDHSWEAVADKLERTLERVKRRGTWAIAA